MEYGININFHIMGCCSIEICRDIERNREKSREIESVFERLNQIRENRIHSSSNRICGQVLFVNFLSLIFILYYFTLIEMISRDGKYICFHYFLPFEPLSSSNPNHNPNHTHSTTNPSGYQRGCSLLVHVSVSKRRMPSTQSSSMYKGVRFGLKPHTEGVRTFALWRDGAVNGTKSDFPRTVGNYDLSVSYFMYKCCWKQRRSQQSVCLSA